MEYINGWTPKKVLTAYLFERMHTYRIHISKYALIQIHELRMETLG